MTRETIIENLQNKGYKASPRDVVKNGVKQEGVIIDTNSNIAPIIYTEFIIENAKRNNETVHDVVEKIIKIYEEHKDIKFDMNEILTKDFIKDNIYIGLQRNSEEDIAKRPCGLEGIESYLYVRCNEQNDEQATMKISSNVLDLVNITKNEAWNYAKINTDNETHVDSLARVVAEMMGIPYNEKIDEKQPVLIISNKSKLKGAATILNKEILAKIAEKYNVDKIIALPSSIHEMLITPYTENIDIEELSEMVKEVNLAAVDPTERLTDRAYIIEMKLRNS